MDWSDTPEQAAFREKVRTLIADRLPERYRELAKSPHQGERIWEFDRKSDNPAHRKAAVEWADALAEQGWVAPHWPQEYGGAGLSPMELFIFNQELAASGVAAVGGSGVKMLGPTLILHGSPEQKARHLPKILSGEAAWAQGYSEPGAGSDLGSLSTSAVRDGDEYVINGQKIWTSGAHTADWMFALVRTDRDAPKHKGISFLIYDIKTPGITVRPLIDMRGNHYFNETFFEDVHIPAAGSVVGKENGGWYVAMTLLDFERSNISGAVEQRRALDALVEGIQPGGGVRDRARTGESKTLRAEIADRYVETEIQFQFSFRIISMQNAGIVPNYEASTAKLYASELQQRVARTATQVFGLYANLAPGDPRAPMDGSYAMAYLTAVPATIRGGTSEVHRNIVADRILGLPD